MGDFNEEFRKAWKRALQVVAAFVFALAICALFGSCRSSKFVDISEDMFIHDTTLVQKLRVDTFMQHDSIFHSEFIKGDTIHIKDYVYKYIYKPKIEYRDSIVYKDSGKTYVTTQTVEVEKKLNWWQKLRLWLGDIMLVALVLAVGYTAFKIYRKLRG